MWVTWRGWVRRQWWTVLVLVVLLALGVATGMAALAGARRTASAYERVLEAVNAPDVISGHANPPAAAVETAATVDGAAATYTDVGFTGYVVGHDPNLVPYYIGAYDHANGVDRQLLVDGRYPSPEEAEEILITERAARRAGLEVGDTVTVAFFTPEFDTVEESLRIVGIGRERRMETGDAALSRDAIILGRAFTRSRPDLRAWSRTTFVADDLDAMVDEIVAIGWPIDETRAADHQRVQDSIRPMVLSLAAIGVVALLATVLVVHQALARLHHARHRERYVLRAMGATVSRLRTADLLVTAAVVLPGVLLGTVGAIALSGLAPVGSVRALDPHRGLHVDWVVLLPGALAVLGVLTAASLVAAARRERADSSLGTVSLVNSMSGRPEVAAGVHLAVGSSRRVRQSFWTTVGLTVTAVGLVVGAVTFIDSLQRLTSSPERYGFGWDVVGRNAYGEIDESRLVEEFANDPMVESIAAGSARNVIVAGERAVPAMLLAPVTAEFWPTIDEGRAPRDDGEILMGRSTLDELGLAIGDRVTVAASAADTSGAVQHTVEVDVVGTAVFPPIELAGLDPARLGVGMTLPFGTYAELLDSDDPQLFRSSPDIAYFDLVEGADPAEFVAAHPDGVPDGRRVPTEWLLSVAPAEILESNSALPVLRGTLVPLSLVVLATVAHAQLTVLRRRRRDYAVLKALGFTRRQVLTTVGWQATITVLVPVLLGVPLGIIGGQVAWRGFAQLIGVLDSTVFPVVAIAVVAVSAVVLTYLVCLVPAALASRVRPAAALRSE